MVIKEIEPVMAEAIGEEPQREAGIGPGHQEPQAEGHGAVTHNMAWEAQNEWIYLGEGEWAPPEDKLPEGNMQQLGKEPKWVYRWRCTVDEDLQLHQEVLEKGYPNRWGAQIPVKTKWNLELLQALLVNYEDREVVEWLRYGWPTGRLPSLPEPVISGRNHKGATEYPDSLQKYVKKEASKGAIMGPYDNIPFQNRVGISPLSTRPKKDSPERQIILDLSFPIGHTVNDGIPKDNYLGFPAKLSFPKVDEFACRIYSLGQGCLMFKIDLSRYFRQLPLDPGDYSLIGYIIEGKVYFDKVLPMGMRSAPYIAQRVTNAIAYIHRQLEYFLLNYVDDFVGAEMKQKAWAAYNALSQLLEHLRVDTSPEKRVQPCTRLEFLGITFDSDTMTMEISEQKMKDITNEISVWLLKQVAKRKEVESLLGKLQFLAKCIRAGRIFMARLIQ